MDIFEQEDATPRDSPVPPEDEAAADDAANGAAEDDASGTETDLPDSPSTPNAVSAVDNVFDVEERTPRKKEKKKLGKSFKRQRSSTADAPSADVAFTDAPPPSASDAISTEVGRRMCSETTDKLDAAWNSLTGKANLLRNYKIFVAAQGLMYFIWLLMYSGLVIPVGQGLMQIMCFLFMFIFIELFRRMVVFKKRCAKIRFEKGVEYEFYSSALSQLKFHGIMVVLPLVLLVVSSLTFTYTMMQGLNYYNVRTPSFTFRNHTTSMLLSEGTGTFFTGGSGCSDERALNFDPRITEHDEERCEYVRCHEDVYDGSQWSGGVRAFVPIYFLIFTVYVVFSLIVSYGHLRYFEGLYLERSISMPFMREMWRKAVSAYTGHNEGSLANFCGPARLRMLHGVLIATQAFLAGAMTVGKLSMTDLWFVEFDISVLLLGYECGRHSPHMGYVKSTGLGDIYGMTQRLNWHRQSMYHYFLLTTILAYLSVSGAYRIHPGTDYQHQPIAQTPGFDSALICHSDIPTEYRSASSLTIALLFVLLVGVSCWLSLSHYIQYQSVKRDHATMLAFARGFKNMLERRRKRVTYAYYDDTGPDLCPPGGFPAEYTKTDRPMASPRSRATQAGEGDATTATSEEAYKRGKLTITNDGIRFMPASGIEGLDDESTAVADILAAKQEMGQPPRVVLTLADGVYITVASQSARSIKKSIDRIMGALEDGGYEEPPPRSPSAHKSNARLHHNQEHVPQQPEPAPAPAQAAAMGAVGAMPLDAAAMQQQMMMMQQQQMMMMQMQDPKQMAAMQQQMMAQMGGGVGAASGTKED